MTTYKISDFYDQVGMKLTIDWNHPAAEAGIREMSMFWSGHPGKGAPIKEHLKFFIEVMAGRAYALSREDSWEFSADEIHSLVLNSEGFCGDSQPWIKIFDFHDETAFLDWEFEEIKGA